MFFYLRDLKPTVSLWHKAAKWHRQGCLRTEKKNLFALLAAPLFMHISNWLTNKTSLSCSSFLKAAR